MFRFRNHASDGHPLAGRLDMLCLGSGSPTRNIWSDEDGRQACGSCGRFILVVNEAMRMRERCALEAIRVCTENGRPAIGQAVANAIRALGEDPPDEGT